MSYQVDKSLAGDGVFTYKTSSGTWYVANITESAPNSGLWTLDFVKLSGNPSPIEVFSIMRTLTDVCMEYVEQKGITNVAIFISAESQIEIEQKTKVFERWLKKDWYYEIVPNMEIKISGSTNPIFQVPTNAIMMTRKQKIQQNTNQNSVPGVEIKFCYNCGIENKSYQFCPNCGSNLKQA